MTFIVQKDAYRCGPVAIFNALRWAGADLPYKGTITKLSNMCECHPPKGTKFRPFIRTLRKMGKDWFEIELVTEPTLTTIEKALRQQKAMIWNFKHARGRHYAMIVAMDNKATTFTVANYNRDDPPLVPVHREALKKEVEQRDRLQRLWILTKLHD